MILENMIFVAQNLTNDFLEADQSSDQEIVSYEFDSYHFDSPLRLPFVQLLIKFSRHS